MNLNLDKSVTSSQQLHIDQRMIGILSVFVVLGICLVVTIVVATNTLSALRAYGSMQTHWTESRKESTHQLTNYIRTGNPLYYARFDSSMQLIRSSTAVLRELTKNETDYTIVRERLLDVHTVPNDVDKMITTFEWFGDFRDFSEAVRYWRMSDSLVYQLDELALKNQDFIASEQFSLSEQQLSIQRVTELDNKLTEKQYLIAGSLASGTQFLNSVIIWISSSLGFILILIGGFLSFKFLKSVKNWKYTIEMSEKKFRSLFEQNPNAVYSLNKDGRFVSGNKALENMIGYPFERFKGKKFDEVFSQSGLEEVKDSFSKATEGKSHTYETVGKRSNGEKIYMEITKIPISVDGNIEGVFGIAHDITERKKAEQKVQEQLEEKNHLLSEVHDRVKNNLALMSGLIQLEKDFNDLEHSKYLNSTVSRIHSMAMVHDQLYHSDTFSSIQMHQYVKELGESIKNASPYNSDNYKLHIRTEAVTLSLKQAIPAGILLNELLNNAFQYAFGNREEGNVEVRLFKNDNKVILSVSDDGIGLPDHLDVENPKTMGLKLVSVLAEQLNASLSVERNGGTTFIVKFHA